MDLDQLFAYADAHRPPEFQLPLRLQPFIPDYVPAVGEPCTFTAPPRPDGEPDFLGLTVLDEPALAQSDPAALALRLRRQLGGRAGGRDAADARPPLGWVADPAGQPAMLEAWVEQVEALHQVGWDGRRRGRTGRPVLSASCMRDVLACCHPLRWMCR